MTTESSFTSSDAFLCSCRGAQFPAPAAFLCPIHGFDARERAAGRCCEVAQTPRASTQIIASGIAARADDFASEIASFKLVEFALSLAVLNTASDNLNDADPESLEALRAAAGEILRLAPSLNGLRRAHAWAEELRRDVALCQTEGDLDLTEPPEFAEVLRRFARAAAARKPQVALPAKKARAKKTK